MSLRSIKLGLFGFLFGLVAAIISPIHMIIIGMDEPDSRFQLFVLTLVLAGATVAGLIATLFGVPFALGMTVAYFSLFAILGAVAGVSSDFLG